ncbi:hypothetical protein [Nonomuraea gerenzanensis]|uniref:Peptidase inhibitor family I36 n=1 Tax=Nonomuraea gerenzanensis TaxID=93944 RepID=A0A1M4EGR0_9ACTN|nr:hypothetical protein [Nonomuraea gerenzanensis]UBU09563.1 hypothetical protein LCN96_35015 [Nonomuraea gerenzanensis]SBO97982.1 hypothetical protein BN4615_P7498 [Nonomuraea gerenzanensis]
MDVTHGNTGRRTAAWAFALLAALVVALAGALISTTPAQAAVSAGPATFPPAPADAQARVAAAVSPGISPAAARTYHANPGDPWICDPGYFCTGVWDYTTGNWKAFDLYACARYALSNWEGDGEILNNQTGNVVSTLYDQNLTPLATYTPDHPTVHPVNWSPVWYVRNC